VTDLRGAALWRTNPEFLGISDPKVSTLLLSPGDDRWLPVWWDEDVFPHLWNEKTYEALRTTIEALPSGHDREAALERIQRLDCSSSDKTLASCIQVRRRGPVIA
jgi:hypothetical protein